MSLVKRYPDAKLWIQAYNIALDKLNAEHIIDCQLYHIPDAIKALPFTIAFLYKFYELGTTFIINAHSLCAVI